MDNKSAQVSYYGNNIILTLLGLFFDIITKGEV